MPKGPPVPIMGICLVKRRNHVCVDVAYPDGRIVEVIRELVEGEFCHHITEHGLATQPPETVKDIT